MIDKLEKLICNRNLTVKDKFDNILVSDVSIDVYKGEFIGIVGESGSGKSLTVKSILGLLPQDLKVEVEYDEVLGYSINRLNDKQKRKLIGEEIGYVPQNTTEFLHPLIKVKNQICDGYRIHKNKSKKEALERAEMLLSKAGIKDTKRVLNSYPVQLSGGMKQRVNIAMALMTDPKIIVADEPTTALDTVTQKQIMELFYKLNKEEITILFISHDLKIIKKFCNRIYVMYNGNIVESGETSSLFKNPSQDYTKKLFDSVPKLIRKTEQQILRNIEV
ncbi:MAG: ABC transporter ATP-binding protein [Sedimentibacter sp.]